MHRKVLIVAAMAHAAIAAMFSSGTPRQGVHRVEGGTKAARRVIASTGGAHGGYIRRPLRTVAQDKRDARKARNRQRNKQAHRGAHA